MSKLSSYNTEPTQIIKKKPPKAFSVLSSIRLKPQASEIKVVVDDGRVEVQSNG